MWELAGKSLTSRFLLGTSGYPSLAILQEAIHHAQTQIITVSMKRQAPQQNNFNEFWQVIQSAHCLLLPNTAGCRDAQTAITTACLARELFGTTWIKLEVTGDDYTLQPDPFELVKAASVLVKEGFEVFPYCTDDLISCMRLIDSGCNILMPGAAPIGSGKGLLNTYGLQLLRERLPEIILIVDAGIGKPSQAAAVMELGFDGVLLNTAIAKANNPVTMAEAFQQAIAAGRTAFEAGLMVERSFAQASTPLMDTPFWHQDIN